MLCNRPARILHSHADLYATTAALSSSAYLLVRAGGLGVPLRIIAGVATGIGARSVSIIMDISCLCSIYTCVCHVEI